MALARTAIRVLHEAKYLPSIFQSQRKMSIELETFKDKETAEEAVFFSKQDERLLRTLLKKVKKQADVTDKHEAVGENACEISNLKEILHKYNVTETDIQALIRWKHGQ